MDLLVEVRQVVFERPVFDLARVTIGMTVVVLPLSVALVEPLLVFPLELVVQDDALDLCVACIESLGDAR